jgi:short-subunit dehydrogenase involved in D-alanine esterification of teichoic acids
MNMTAKRILITDGTSGTGPGLAQRPQDAEKEHRA